MAGKGFFKPTKSLCALIGAGSICVILVACATTPANSPSSQTDPAGTESTGPESENELARQAEADVAAFEQLQANVNPAEQPPVSNRILWNTTRTPPPVRQPSPRIENPGSSTWNPNELPDGHSTETSTDSDPLADSATDTVAKALNLNSPEERQLREMLVDLSRVLYQESTEADMPIKELMVIAATTMVSPERALSPDAMRGLTERERELLIAFQTFFGTLGKRLDGSREAEEVFEESIAELRRSITREPQLTIPAAHLCTVVDGFADYQKFPKYSFLAMSGQQAVVYTEVGSYMSELDDSGEYVTRLSQKLTIYSERDGIPVWSEDWFSTVDRVTTKRRDFFLTQVMTIPQSLGVGRYNLKIQLRDETTGAETETAIAFDMVADPKLAVQY